MANNEKQTATAAKETVAPPATNKGAVTKSQTVSTKGIDAEILKSPYKIVALNNDAADKAIASIVNSGKALRKLAHETACGILLHYEEHGDYTRLVPLYKAIEGALSASMRTAFVEWVIGNSSLRWNEDKKNFYHNKRDKRIPANKAGYFDYDAEKPGQEFFNFERPARLPQAQNFAELMAAFIRRAETLLVQRDKGIERNGKRIKVRHEIDEKTVKELEAFAAAHGIEWEKPEESEAA